MLHELTPEQAAKLARLWQWQKYHSYILNDMVGRITWEFSGNPFLLGGQQPVPNLSDDTTRDGLLRTCRKAWMDDAFAMRSLSGKWKVYVRSGFEEHVFEGATEESALLAAILAAPEGK